MQFEKTCFGAALCALALLGCGGNGNDDGDVSTVTGTVSTREATPMLVAGATVELYGTNISATTDDNGAFTLRNVPHGDAFFVSQANGNWGTVDYYYVPEETGGMIINLGVIPDEEIEAIATTLGRSLSASDGIVDVSFYPFADGVQGAQGGETASISAPSDAPFTFDLDGNPVAQAGVIVDDEGFGELVYASVDTSDGPITADVMGVDGVSVCDVEETPGVTYPILAKSITFVYAYCQPAP